MSRTYASAAETWCWSPEAGSGPPANPRLVRPPGGRAANRNRVKAPENIRPGPKAPGRRRRRDRDVRSVTVFGHIHGRYGLLALVAVLAATLVCFPRSAPADGIWMVTPSAHVQETYDSNRNFSFEDEEEDYITRVGPSVALDYQAERLSLGVNSNMDFTYYANDRNSNTQYWTLNGDGSYRLTERMGMSLGALYSREQTLDAGLEESGVSDSRSDRERIQGRGGWSYVLTERMSLGLSGSLSRTEYDGAGQKNADNGSASLSWSYILNNRGNSVYLSPGYRFNDTDVSEVDSYSLSLGYQHNFSERWQLNMSAGARLTDVRYRTSRRRLQYVPELFPPFWPVSHLTWEDETSWGGVANISLTRNWGDSSASLTFRRDLAFNAQGEPLNTNRGIFSYRHNLTYRLNAGVAADVSYYESERDVDDQEVLIWQVTPSLSYVLFKNANVGLSYTYAGKHDYQTEGEDEAERHKVKISFSYGFPMEL